MTNECQLDLDPPSILDPAIAELFVLVFTSKPTRWLDIGQNPAK